MSEAQQWQPPAAMFAAGTAPELSHGDGRVVLVPTGAVEQHGPHLPVGTDAWIATAVARAVAQPRPGVLVAEPLAYGCSGHHTTFGGTVTLRVRTFLDLVFDVATSLARDGYRTVFVNGHGGNRAPLGAVLQELLDAGTSAWAVSYFEVLEDVVERLFPEPERAVGHACAMETSLVMHLWPALVRLPLPPPGGAGRWPEPFLYSSAPVVHHRRFEDLDERGVVGAPRAAGPEVGRELFDAAAQRVGHLVDRIAGSAGGGPVTTPGAL